MGKGVGGIDVFLGRQWEGTRSGKDLDPAVMGKALPEEVHCCSLAVLREGIVVRVKMWVRC